EFDGTEGEVVLFQHPPHDLADRTGRTHHRNAWHHAWAPFVKEGKQIRPMTHLSVKARLGKGKDTLTGERFGEGRWILGLVGKNSPSTRHRARSVSKCLLRSSFSSFPNSVWKRAAAKQSFADWRSQTGVWEREENSPGTQRQ